MRCASAASCQRQTRDEHATPAWRFEEGRHQHTRSFRCASISAAAAAAASASYTNDSIPAMPKGELGAVGRESQSGFLTLIRMARSRSAFSASSCACGQARVRAELTTWSWRDMISGWTSLEHLESFLNLRHLSLLSAARLRCCFLFLWRGGSNNTLHDLRTKPASST